MSRETSSIRGYHAIRAVVADMQTLAEGLLNRRPPATSMTLRARDYDLLARWPKAAALHGIYPSHDVLHWHGFALRREHGRPIPPKQGAANP